MKFKNLFLASLALVSMAACSNEDDPIKGGSGEKANAYMQLVITTPQGGLTKTETGKTSNDEDYERKVGSALIILADNDHKIVSTYPITSAQFTQSGATISTGKIQLTNQENDTYNIYVLANPSGDITSTQVTAGVTVTDLVLTAADQETMKSKYANIENGTTGSFLMFSECQGSDKTKPNQITISADNNYDHPATCTGIKLERLAVKIRSPKDGFSVKEGDSTKISDVQISDANLTLEGFKLLNGANKSYLQQHWTAAYSTNVPPITNTLDSKAKTAKTDYYNLLGAFRTLTKKDHPSPTEVPYTVVKDTWTSVPYYGATDSIYCLENNATYSGGAYVEPSSSNTTGLIYRWNVKDPGTNSDKLAGDNCFYWYEGKFYYKLADIYSAYSSRFPAGEDALKTAMSTAYSGGEDKISDFRKTYNIKVYTNGIMYYTYFIKDKNYNQVSGTSTTGYVHSVLRNTIYNLKIKTIKSLGTDIPGGWNPDLEEDKPIEQKNIYMEVEASVNKWILSDQEIELQ